jgi:hypothetical protein
VSTPDCATAWQAGFAHFERWETGGQTADRDAAIAYLEDALADPPEGLNLDLHLALAGLHSARAGDPASGAESGADVSAAIRHARSGLADLRDEPVCASGAAEGGAEAMRVGTELRLLLGFALAEQFSEEQGGYPPATPRACPQRAVSATKRSAC